MKTLIKYIYVIFAVCIGNLAIAQDFHFSHYDATTLYMNPALTGMYANKGGDYKIYADYRSQWKALGIKPFSTAYIAYDQPFKKFEKNFGIGAYLVNQNAGVGRFNTLNFMLSGAYDIMNKAEGKHYLTTGLQMGFFYKSFNPNNFTYDEQYDPSIGDFNTSIASGETFAKTSLFKFDANLGVYYKYLEDGKKMHPFVGLSVQHLTKPNESFTTEKSKLPMRINFNAGCDIAVSEKIDLSPRFLYMNQAKASELNVGILAYYKIKEPYEILLGFDYRNKDAIIFHLGIKQNRHIFRFSYDMNSSYLNAYSGGRGAWEFSLILTGEKGKPLIKARF
ncbi:MAG: PorP/SprF family type IX secretion system membrane protein [Bacteroidetes bacterium]|nr:PorP/SprF family type IX secretion system membrane protein [Bacteroidota bacterium]